MTASRITIISNATSNNMVLALIVSTGLKAALESCISKISCGIISGNPSTAIMAAFCWALAAIAARKVKIRLRLQPPNNTRPMKAPAFTIGLPKNKLKSSRLSRLMISIRSELNNNLASTKCDGEAIE